LSLLIIKKRMQMKYSKKTNIFTPDESKAIPYDYYDRVIQEQCEIQQYILTKPLDRPKTSVWTILIIIFLYSATAFFLSLATIYIFRIRNSITLTYLFFFLLGFIIIAKFLTIKLVECYQHYAKEEIRRRCLCKPTCSEYALAVLKKIYINSCIV